MEKKALGKGLGALLPSSKASQLTEATDVQRIRIENIAPNRYQPRHTFPRKNLLNWPLPSKKAEFFSRLWFAAKVTACTN